MALPAWRQLSSLSALLAAAARMANLNGMPAAALAFVVAPALSRPDGSAFMAVRHLEGLPALRRFLTVGFKDTSMPLVAFCYESSLKYSHSPSYPLCSLHFFYSSSLSFWVFTRFLHSYILLWHAQILIEHHADVFAEAASPATAANGLSAVSVPLPLEIPSPNHPSRQIFLPESGGESDLRNIGSNNSTSDQRTSPRSPNNASHSCSKEGGISKGGSSSPCRTLSPRTALAAAVRHVPGATLAPSSEVGEVAKVLSSSVSAFLASAIALASKDINVPGGSTDSSSSTSSHKGSSGSRHRSNEPARTFNLAPESLKAALSPIPNAVAFASDASPSKAFSSSLLTRPRATITTSAKISAPSDPIDIAPLLQHSPFIRASPPSGEVGDQWVPAVHGHQLRSAAERRRTVHACRALRAQIRRFEDAFTVQHSSSTSSSSSSSTNAAPPHSPGAGASPLLRRSSSSSSSTGAPKGADRLPLESTYAQYREWKKCIRHHAASQIQALARATAARLLFARLVAAAAAAASRGSSEAPLRAKDREVTSALGHGTAPATSVASPVASAAVKAVSPHDATVVPAHSTGNKRASSKKQPEEQDSLDNHVASPNVKPDRANSGSKSKSKRSSTTSQQQQQALSVGRGVSPRALWKNPSSEDGTALAHDTQPSDVVENSPAIPELSHPPIADVAATPSASAPVVPAVSEIAQQPAAAAAAAVTTSAAARTMASTEAPATRDNARPKEKAPIDTGGGDSVPALPPSLEQRIEALEAEKKRVKNLLKTYDAAFAQRHQGRLPTKAEKEPIRALYEDYHRVKQALQVAQDQEQTGAAAVLASAANERAPVARSEVPTRESSIKNSSGSSSSSSGLNDNSNSSDNTVNSAANAPRRSDEGHNANNNAVVSMGGPPVVPISKRAQPQQLRATKDRNQLAFTDEVASFTKNGNVNSSNTNSVGRMRGNAWTNEAPPASPHDKASGKKKGSGDSGSTAETVHPGAVPVANAHDEEVRALLVEKRALHEMLKRYEREFEATYGRVVKTLDDIAIVQGDYNRYKQLKARLASLQANHAS